MIHVVKPYSYKRNLERYLRRKNASTIDIPVDIKFDSFNSLDIVKFMVFKAYYNSLSEEKKEEILKMM